MTSPVSYSVEASVATVGMDDGKANVIGPVMIAELNAALDQAQTDGAVVLLAGRPGVFSAGFDLSVLSAGDHKAVDMLLSGFRLAERLLAFPRPVVIACTGHAVAMGAFLLLSGDHRVGPAGPYKFVANEVAIGLTMPRSAVEILRQRLAPADFNRALILAQEYTGEDARRAGFFDELAEPEGVVTAATAGARRLSALDHAAHAASKLRAREPTLTALRRAIGLDAAELGSRSGPGLRDG
ncbi:MAG: crotonase/enoyl-CoA hydratase family protein [Mycobacteriales bacterium]